MSNDFYFNFEYKSQKIGPLTVFMWLSPELNISYITGKCVAALSFDLRRITKSDANRSINTVYHSGIDFDAGIIDENPNEYSLQLNFRNTDSNTVKKMLNALKTVYGINIDQVRV